MAAENFTPLFHAYAPFSTPSSIYTVPSGFQAMVTNVIQINQATATSVSVDLYRGVATAPRYVQRKRTLDPEGDFVMDAPFMLATGDSLLASADVPSSVTLMVNGIVTPN